MLTLNEENLESGCHNPTCFKNCIASGHSSAYCWEACC
jgi:hypothetical protein